MRLRSIFIAGAIALASTAAFASQQKSYELTNAGHTGYYNIRTSPENYRVLWQRYIGRDDASAIFSDMGSVVDGVAYFSFNTVLENKVDGSSLRKRLLAVDTETGNTLWTVDKKGQGWMGLPEIGGDRLFATYGNNKYDVLKAYDPKTGKILYSTPLDTMDTIPLQSSIYAYTSDGLISLDQSNGKRQWLTSVRSRGETRGYAVNNKYVVVKRSDGVNVYDRITGKNIFNVDVPHGRFANNIVRELVLDDKTNTVYTSYGDDRGGMWDASLYAIDLNQRAVRWILYDQDNNVQPVVIGDHVYTFSKRVKQLNAVNAVTGKIEWSWVPPEDDHISYGVPVATSDVIFIAGDKRTYAVSLKTHKTVWQIDLSGHMTIGDDKLIIMSLRPGSRQDYDYITSIALN